MTKTTEELISYLNTEIDEQYKELLKANQEKIIRHETLINLYVDSLDFLGSNEPNENTKWEHEEYSKLVQALKEVSTIASLGLMETKLTLLRNRVIYKDDKAS